MFRIKILWLILISIGVILVSLVLLGQNNDNPISKTVDNNYKKIEVKNMEDSNDLNVEYKTAIFAGGCFWCMEFAFEVFEGVKDAVSGYTGGDIPNPSYEEVSTGKTGHYEAVKVIYNPAEISYERLLEIFWKNIDPTDSDGQFYDRGSQYRTAIFYLDENQKELAEESKRRIEKAEIFEKISTQILPAKEFYPAEKYHQDYYQVEPVRFQIYHKASGRENYFRDAWKGYEDFRLFPERQSYWIGYTKPSIEILKQILTPLQFKVTQENGTEQPFNNEYWNNHDAGIYVDVVSGEPLFSSIDKFDSGTGWPSFTKPLEPENIVEVPDYSYGMERTEVRSKHADSHLGHVFKENTPTGLRYCIDSAALRFIPAQELERKGYVAYKKLFE